MKRLASALTTSLALLGAGLVSVIVPPISHAASPERLEQARQRQAGHARAIAHGDPSRSPYFRSPGPAGQSGSRHDEQAWYRELIERSSAAS